MDEPIMALAWGVLIAGITQFVFQLPFLNQIKMLPRFKVVRNDEGVKRILKLMGPALFGVSVTQLNLLIDTMIASFLVSGSISWLYYSDRLMEFPLGILAVALGTVVLPGLSKSHAQQSSRAFNDMLDWGLRLLLILGVPSAVGLALLAQPMIATLFQSGVFDAHDVTMATYSLWAYSLGLIGFMLIKVLAPGFYSRQDTRTPVRIAVIAMVANMVMNLIFVMPLKHAGLALATSLAAILNAWLLYRGLRREGVYTPCEGWGWILSRILIASLLMVVAIVMLNPAQEFWLGQQRLDKALYLAGLITAGAITYFSVLYIFGVRMHHFRHRP
jgi:putative peptidoglycan lipid II flippase